MFDSTLVPRLQLALLTEAELAELDCATINLACATGLPGAEDLDVSHCLAVLDGWAGHVGQETARCAVQFEREPGAFGNSWAYFRVLVLATVLQQDCGVHYDPTLIDRDDFFADARNLFIHGVLEGQGGTCSSLPPVYVAVGRRLGYPLKLVQTSSHLFARWDDPVTGERFNVECTSHGLNCHADDYYRGWPFPATPEEVERSGWLVSLTPREELASFLANRGHCWLDNRRHRGAVEAYARAASLAPRQGGYRDCLESAVERWRLRLAQLAPPQFPAVTVHVPGRPLPELPPELEYEIVYLEVVEALLEDPNHCRQWWEPLRRAPHVRPADLPSHITVCDPAAFTAGAKPGPERGEDTSPDGKYHQ
jgi:hypothetical protein